MRLHPEQFEQFVIGCDTIECATDGLRCHRLPLGLRSTYDDPTRFAVRRDCLSCVRIRFLTDSTQVSLELAYDDAAEAMFQGAIVVDSEAPKAFGPSSRVARWSGAVFQQTSRALRTIDLWLPHLAVTRVAAMHLDDGGRIVKASPLSIRWLAYGDSITQGFCATLPTSRAIARCALALDAEVHNLAVGGSTLKAELSEFTPERPFDLVTIAYGACDFQENVPLSRFVSNAQQLIDALHRIWTQAAIVVITPLLWPATPSSPTRNSLNLSPQDYRDALASLQHNRPFVHLVRGESLLDPDPELYFDWIHPNDCGFAQNAQNLLPRLKRALESRKAPNICREGTCV